MNNLAKIVANQKQKLKKFLKNSKNGFKILKYMVS